MSNCHSSRWCDIKKNKEQKHMLDIDVGSIDMMDELGTIAQCYIFKPFTDRAMLSRGIHINEVLLGQNNPS